MSTKIYNGLIFKNKTLNEVYDGLMSIKPSVVRNKQQALLKSMCRIMSGMLDEHEAAIQYDFFEQMSGAFYDSIL